MTHPATIERITRSLAYMLRHQPEKFDLRLDPYGWAGLDDVIRALNEKLGEPIEPSDLEDAIGSGDRPRYQIEDGRVRALYGHSIEVLPGEPSKPPELLYVGIGSRDAERALQYGLRGGRRRFLHLARTPEEGREVGRRAGREYAVLTVFALDAWEEGINFYDRQALFLSEEIPTQFIEIQGKFDDGVEPMPRGRSERAPRENGRSRGRRGNDRGRDRRDERERGARRPARERDGGRPSGGRREERRDERRPRARDEDRREDRREAPPARERVAARAAAPEEPVAVQQASVDDTFGQGVHEEVTPQAPPARTPRPEPAAEAPREPEVAPPEPARESDDEAPFGMGI